MLNCVRVINFLLLLLFYYYKALFANTVLHNHRFLFKACWKNHTNSIESNPGCTLCYKKSDAKIEITITTTNLVRIKYPLSSFNCRLSGAKVANFNKIYRTVFEQQLFKKWNSKTEVSNMEKSPYQFVHNTTSHSLCSKWSPFAQTFACLLWRSFVLCCCRTSCLQTL